MRAIPTLSKFPYSLVTRTYNPAMLFRRLRGGDIAHVHLIGGFSPLVFSRLKRNHHAVAWTAHDPQVMCGQCLLPTDGSDCLGLGSSKCKGCGNALDKVRKRVSSNHHTPNVDAFIAPSKWMWTNFVKSGYPKEKLHLIKNGIDMSEFPESPVPTEPIILFCGRMTPHKGLMMLLRAFEIVLGEVPDAKLVLMGDGERAAYGRSFVREQGIENAVMFVGYQKCTAFFYKIAKVVAHPSSIPENCSLVLLEAHATGRPTVSTRVGGNSEVVKEGVTGALANPGDHEGMAEHLIRILGSDDVATRMGKAARIRTKKHFNINVAIDKHDHLFHNLMEEATR